MSHNEIILSMYRNHYATWEILAHMMIREVNRPAAIRAITTALRLKPDEVTAMLDSFENNI
jgi:cytochrome c-type biogenesis protein CcmH/NrfG